MRDFNLVAIHATTDNDRVQLLTVQSHSSDWLQALPGSSCNLRLDNKAIRVTTGLGLGLALCQPHSCQCGAMVAARGLHSLSCKISACRSLRHFQINYLIFHALKRVDASSTEESKGLERGDGKKHEKQKSLS